MHEFEYDPVDQLLGATLKNSSTQAILKQLIYSYDKAGNRTSEQIDMGVTKSVNNSLNQMTGLVTGGPVRFAGRLNEPGNVTVGTNAAKMSLSNTSFVVKVK